MKTHRLLIVLFIASLTFNTLADDGWTRFRGPNGTGGIDGANPPSQWTDGQAKWQVALPGEGHSSPVIYGNRIYTTATNPATAEQRLVSIDATKGEIVWSYRLESIPYQQHRYNSFASSSPAVDEQHVYIPVSSNEHHALVAVTHEGTEAWRYDLGPVDSQHGTGVSPIIYQESIIMMNDQKGPSFAVAIDRATGKLKWKTPREAGTAAYATPCIMTDAQGNDQLITAGTANGVTALDPNTGKVLWQYAEAFPLRVVGSPIIADGLIINTCGQGGGGKRLVAIRPGSIDGTRPAELAYEQDKALPYVPVPVYHDGMIFLIADGGVATCMNAKTGETIWRERLGGDYFSSPVRAGNVLYFMSREGKVVTVRASKAFEKIAEMDLGEASHATPAIAGDAIYIRTLKTLRRF